MNADLRSMVPWLLAIAAAASLAACGSSAPARYYTLGATAVAAATPPLAGRSIIVGPIEFPPYLDRPQMAIRRTGGEIEFRQFDRWAQPLESSFTSTLTDDLIVLAGTQQVFAAPVPRELPGDFQLLARVSRFDVDDTGQAVLVVQWYVADRSGKVLLTPRRSTYKRDVPAPPQPQASAAALGGTIADFATDITRSLAGLESGTR